MPLYGTLIKILDNASVAGAGNSFVVFGGGRNVIEANGKTTSGTGSCNINIEVSDNRVTWDTAGTITLTLGTAQTSDGFTMNAPWYYIRANVTSISGTGASVSVIISA